MGREKGEKGREKGEKGREKGERGPLDPPPFSNQHWNSQDLQKSASWPADENKSNTETIGNKTHLMLDNIAKSFWEVVLPNPHRTSRRCIT